MGFIVYGWLLTRAMARGPSKAIPYRFFMHASAFSLCFLVESITWVVSAASTDTNTGVTAVYYLSDCLCLVVVLVVFGPAITKMAEMKKKLAPPVNSHHSTNDGKTVVSSKVESSTQKHTGPAERRQKKYGGIHAT